MKDRFALYRKYKLEIRLIDNLIAKLNLQRDKITGLYKAEIKRLGITGDDEQKAL